MRTHLALAGLALGLAASFAPLPAASANCTVVLDDGSCVNACTAAGGAYAQARAASGNVLPAIPFNCPL